MHAGQASIGGLALIVVDYLQLVHSTSKRAQESRYVEVSEVSASLKALSRELSVPVVVLSQLNRNPTMRVGGRPVVNDLRDSGSIEDDADVVALLTRPEYYAEDEAERESLRGQATLFVAKHRHGPTGEVLLTFLKEFTRFESRASNGA